VSCLIYRAVVSERYVTAGELAQLMGVSVRTIRRMTTAGMPSQTWGMTRTRRYLPSEAMAWASDRGASLPAKNPPGRRRNAVRRNTEVEWTRFFGHCWACAVSRSRC
jgi:phage terminase Nu1 subunit (DNA packaging protein)